MHCLAINNFCCKTTRDYEQEKIMASEHPKDNQECKSDEHTKHLCYFVSYGYHVDNEEEYKGLVRNRDINAISVDARPTWRKVFVSP